MRDTIKNKLIFILKYSVGIFLLFWIISRVNRDTLVDTITNLTFFNIVVILLIALVNLTIQFRLWKFLVESHSRHFDLKDLLPSFFAGFAFRLMIPGGHAEFSKVFLMRGRKRGKVIAFGIEKFFQTILKIVLVALAIPVVFPEYKVSLLTVAFVIIIAVSVLPFVLKKERFAKHQEKDVSYTRIFLLSLVHSIPIFLTIALQYYYLLKLFYNVSFFQVIIVTVFIWGAGIIPISVSGLGVRENLAAFFLAQYNVPGASAVAISLFVFFINAIIPAMIGVISILKRRHEIKDAGIEIKNITKSVYNRRKQLDNGKLGEEK